MKEARKLLNEFLVFINVLVKNACIVLMAVMTCIVLLQVFARSIPWIPKPQWTEELSRYVMIYIAFIGASNGLLEWNNIGVDFVISRLPKKIKLLLSVIIRIIVLGFWAIVSAWGLKYFPLVGGKQVSATMGFPMLYAQSALIIGGILCCIQAFGQIINLLAGGENNA